MNPFQWLAQLWTTSSKKSAQGVESNITTVPDINVSPRTRRSAPDTGVNQGTVVALNSLLGWVTPDFDFESIPLIRKLVRTNANFGQAVWDIVNLGNTGHKVMFNSEIPPDQVDKMRVYLADMGKKWSEGTNSMDGIINKMLAQIIISGAHSVEWVPDVNMKSIKKVAFVKPENIRFKYNLRKGMYEPYQINTGRITDGGSIKLNTNTYKYVGLNNDGELPYGIPPYITALDPAVTQQLMVKSIRVVAQQLGLPGFLKVELAKPPQTEGEKDAAYEKRLDARLAEAQVNLQGAFNTGIVVGYADDYDTDFQGVAKNAQGSHELFKINEQQMITGLKGDPSMYGRDYGSSETQMTIVLTKMLSELTNIQNIVKNSLEFGYALALTLAGFKFKTLEVEFKRSTLLDEFKLQQGLEVKITNLHKLFYDGIIDLEQYADEMGYEKPSQKEPRYLWDVAAGEANGNEEKVKDAQRKKTERGKSKPQDKKPQ